MNYSIIKIKKGHGFFRSDDLVFAESSLSTDATQRRGSRLCSLDEAKPFDGLWFPWTALDPRSHCSPTVSAYSNYLRRRRRHPDPRLRRRRISEAPIPRFGLAGSVCTGPFRKRKGESLSEWIGLRAAELFTFVPGQSERWWLRRTLATSAFLVPLDSICHVCLVTLFGTVNQDRSICSDSLYALSRLSQLIGLMDLYSLTIVWRKINQYFYFENNG